MSAQRGWIQAVLLGLLGLLAALAAAWQVDAWAPPTAQPARWLGAGVLLLGFTGWWGTLTRRAQRVAGAPLTDSAVGRRSTWMVVHASQTGTASEIARRCADLLRGAGRSVDLVAMDDLDAARLADCRRLVCVVATTGDGEPPTEAMRFARVAMAQAMSLGHLEYATLALGDRSYEQFCAFGRAVEAWLQRCGARPLRPAIEVDAGDPAALSQWYAWLDELAGRTAPAHPWQPDFQTWCLSSRSVLNPGSVGAPIHLLRFAPGPGVTPGWQPGAIASVRMRHPPARVEAFLQRLGPLPAAWPAAALELLRAQLPHCQLPSVDGLRSMNFAALPGHLQRLPTRDYSIASTAADGCIELVTREQRGDDGELGLGSAWLCRDSAVGDAFEVHVRANPQFGLPGTDAPLILIGAGTGIAGLRGLLRARIQRGHRRNWLLFGERDPSCDALFDAELRAAQEHGMLDRLDRAFSRDPDAPRHVQDLLSAHAPRLRAWVDAGAHLSVCGSAATMGKAVDLTLRRLIGDARVDALIDEHRYHRDVY